jgi:hypothetical protein
MKFFALGRRERPLFLADFDIADVASSPSPCQRLEESKGVKPQATIYSKLPEARDVEAERGSSRCGEAERSFS